MIMNEDDMENEIFEHAADNIDDLNLLEGIQVWGANQDVFEEQAIKELQFFAENQKGDRKESNLILEEGEILENESEKSKETALDLNKYIKDQELLRKKQELFYSTCGSNRKRKKCRQTQKVSDSKVDLANVIEFHEGVDVDSTTEDPYYLDRDSSGSEYVPSDRELDSASDKDSEYQPQIKKKCPSVGVHTNITKNKRKPNSKPLNLDKVVDDGVMENYKSRLKAYYDSLEQSLAFSKNDDDDEEDKVDYHLVKGKLKIPIDTWNKLYSYQQEAVKWLWKLHKKPTGGILGDEMGLGKTVQIITFLLSLEYSRIMSCHGRFNGVGPSIIVCPATVIHQWVKHFHEWAPEFRIGVLHQSGSFKGIYQIPNISVAPWFIFSR